MINFTNPVAFVDPQGDPVTLKANPATVPAWATFTDSGGGFYNIQGTAPTTGGPWAIEIIACDPNNNESTVHTLTITCDGSGGAGGSTGTFTSPNPAFCLELGTETTCDFITNAGGPLACDTASITAASIICSVEFTPATYAMNLSGVGLGNVTSLEFTSSCGPVVTMLGPFSNNDTITQAQFDALKVHFDCADGYQITMECS